MHSDIGGADGARELLRVISAAQSRFITGSDPRELFDGLLADLLRLTESEYGFLCEVWFEIDGTPYLDSRDLTDTPWGDETRHRFRSLARFFNRVMVKGKPLISNDPARDLRSNRSTPGRPGLTSFLGLPFFRGDTLVGVAGVANRKGGYDKTLVAALDPFVVTCANLIDAHRVDAARRESEQALIESETRLRALVDTALDAILTIDARGLLERVNPAVERMFGYGASELVGASVNMLIPASDMMPQGGAAGRGGSAAPAPDGLPFLVRSALGRIREMTGRRKDGSTFPVEAVLSEMAIADRRMFTAILRDISERKNVERLKSEFVATVSHELRTPLTSIRGSLGLVTGGVAGPLSPQAREMIEIALANSERLSLLINDILDIEKIESGRLEFRLQSIDLGQVVRRSVEANQGYAVSHHVGLALVGEPPEATVFADEDRLGQVLANLMSNATKFSPKGETVDVVVERIAEDQLRVSVRDRGPGIPDEFRPRMFQRFAQADSSDTREKGGTGLGLSIAKAIVERMGGRIGFEAADGGGTRFFFDLPAYSPRVVRMDSDPAGKILVCDAWPGRRD